MAHYGKQEQNAGNSSQFSYVGFWSEIISEINPLWLTGKIWKNKLDKRKTYLCRVSRL